jgi:DNA-binding NtrC family response regulator
LHLSQVAAKRLLLIHISGGHRAEIVTYLQGFGYEVTCAESVESAIPELTADALHSLVLIVACDDHQRVRQSNEDLIDGIVDIRRLSADSQVLMTIDGSADIAFCCRAINSGLAGFIESQEGQIDPEVLKKRLDHAEARFLLARQEANRVHSGEIFDQTGIVGCSRAMALLLSQATRAAAVSDAPVVVYGESGTGKQLLAEMIHRLDPKRSTKPFLSVNCAAITGSLAESALFGHVKGAYTGATDARDGYFRAADGGTVFLDEITELSLDLQPKLLRFLQEGMVLPVGADTEHEVDLRIIAAANRRIPALVEEGTFRLDLYQRLNVIMLEIPALRERRDDIPLLVDFFVKKYSAHYDKPVTRVDRRVHELLARCPLDGNVRELENIIRRALAMKHDGDEIMLRDLPSNLLEHFTANATKPGDDVLMADVVENACAMIAAGGMTLPDFVDECERLVLSHSIALNGDSQADLSRMLGLSTRTFYNKRRKYRL